MARGRTSNVAVDDDKHSVEYVNLPRRKMIVATIDLTSMDGKLETTISKFKNELDDYRNAIVKPVVRYRQGDEDLANRLLDELLIGIREVAHHVRKPEVQVIRDRRVRAPEVAETTDPMEAAKLYLESRPSKLVNSDLILEALGRYVDGVVFGEGRPHPEPFHISYMGGRDWMPFRGEYGFDLVEGVYGITAKYDGEEGGSNRGGKSAFTGGVLYAWSGKAGHKPKTMDKLVHRGAENGETYLVLTRDDGDTRISRTVGGTTKLQVGDITGVKKGQAEIDRILGMSFEDFTRTCFVRQKDLIGLLGETSAPIREALERWLGLGAWSDVYKKVLVDLREQEKEVEHQRRDVEDAERQLQEMGERPTKGEMGSAKAKYVAAMKACGEADRVGELEKKLELVREASDLESVAEKLPGLVKRAKEAKSEIEVLVGLRSERKAAMDAPGVVDRVDELVKKLELIQEVVGLKSVAAKLPGLMKEVGELKVEIVRLIELRAERKTELDATVGAHRAAVKAAKDGFDGTCPVDDCECPRTAEINQDVERFKTAKEEAADKRAAVKDVFNKVDDDLNDRLRELESLEREVDEARTAKERIAAAPSESVQEVEEELEAAKQEKEEAAEKRAEARAAFDKATDDLEGWRETLEKIEGLVEVARSAKQKIDVAPTDSIQSIGTELEIARDAVRDADGVGDLEKAWQDLTNRAARHDEQESRAEKAREYVDTVALPQLRLLRQLAMLSSRKGVPSYQMEATVVELEGQVNSVLEQVGLPVRVEFEPERELQKAADACRSCGWEYPKTTKVKFCEECGSERGKATSDEFTTNVVEMGRTQELALDSGGGTDLIALALRIALARFLGSKVLFLDEVLGSLDPKNLAGALRMLRKLPEVGFKQVFVISHRPEVKDALVRNIVVTRYQDEGRSTVEVE